MSSDIARSLLEGTKQDGQFYKQLKTKSEADNWLNLQMEDRKLDQEAGDQPNVETESKETVNIFLFGSYKTNSYM